MDTKLFARHGDVLIYKVLDSKLEPKLEKRESTILAYGEVTGHYHELRGDMSVNSEVLEDGIYFELYGDGELTHQEHETIKLSEGKYVSIIQEEYDPITYSRKVLD